MAKIDNGPLAANIRGSVGELVFYQSRFGQIVQSKGIRPYPGSPAQQLSISRFRLSTRAFWLLNGKAGIFYNRMAKARGENPAQAWISSYYHWLQGEIWNYPIYDRPDKTLVVTSHIWAPPFLTLTTNLDSDPEFNTAQYAIIQNGIVDPIHSYLNAMLLSSPPTPENIAGVSAPFYILLQPYYALGFDVFLGQSYMALIT